MGEDPKIDNTITEETSPSTHIDAYTKSLKTIFEEMGDQRDDIRILEEIHKNEATMELEFLVSGYHPDDQTPEELEQKIQKHIENGANPYAIFINSQALTNAFTSPTIMQALVDSGVDFNIGHKLTMASSPKELCTQVFDSVFYLHSSYGSSGHKLFWEDYAKSQEILTKAFPDFKPDMDTFLAKEDTQHYFKANIHDFNAYMMNRGLLEVCEKHGVLSKEDNDKFLRRHTSNMPENIDLKIDVQHDKRFNGVRVGFAEYYTKAGDTLPDIAKRFKPYIGEGISYGGSYGTAALVSRIIEENELDKGITPGMILRIPVDPEAHFIATRAGDLDLTTLIFDFYQNTGDVKNNFAQAKDINNISGQLMSDPAAMLHIPVTESFNKVASLGLPENKDVTLAVVETNMFPDDYEHHRATFETASKLDYFRSGGDGGNVIAISAFSYKISNALDMLLYQSKEAREGDIIFSKSFAYTPLVKTFPTMEDTYDSSYKLYNDSARLHFDFFEENNTITFASIGNDHDTNPNTYPPVESAMSARGVTVGAIHEANGVKYIAAYSSSGADICAGPIHPIDNELKEGTSFSTPDFGSLYRNVASAFGDDLTHEEIMVAAFYSTDLDIKDFDVNSPPNGFWSDDSPMEEQMAWAKFDINGAGIPYHPRAGRGMIDSDKWAENLELMKGLKSSSCNESEIAKQHTNLRDIEPEKITEDGKEFYVYKIPLSEDMTLGKITMALPQEYMHRSRTFLESPSGMDIHMPHLRAGMFSTFALACEDIKEGQFLTLKTEEPYTQDADIIIRGFTPGNTIEAFRDFMLQNNLAQTPHSTYQVQKPAPEATAQMAEPIYEASPDPNTQI